MQTDDEIRKELEIREAVLFFSDPDICIETKVTELRARDAEWQARVEEMKKAAEAFQP